MKTTVYYNDFNQAFRNHGRQDNFTSDGLQALFDYIEELEQDTGEEVELDVIALCCEYAEYNGLTEFWNDYDQEQYPDIDAIRDWTQVIEFDGGFIIADF